MEPPTNRPRLTRRPYHGDDNDNDDSTFDGDELNFQPQQVSEWRDQDLQLERKRAKAGNRFQKAMAHIFSKYARDFTDVGDEIDLETGEVIVNNGHLANMRYEGDIGVEEEGSGDGDSEDEGVRLEDLADDEGMRLEDIPDDWDGEDDAEDEEQDQEQGQIMHGQPSGQYPMSLVPTSIPQFGVSPMLSLPMNDVFMEFDPRAAFFGAPPFGAQPSRLPNDLGEVAWDSLSRPKPAPARRRGKLRGSTNHRRSFPTYNGERSIWASAPGYNDGWPSHPDAKAQSRGRKSRAVEERELDTATDGEEDVLLADQDPSHRKVTAEIVAHGNVEPPTEAAPEHCRRSRRTRKPVEFLGKISWSEALGQRKPGQLAVELRTKASLQRETYASADGDIGGQALPTPPESGHETSDNEPPEVLESSRVETIPDSQETASSKRSSPPRANNADQSRVQYVLGDASNELSDDERPVLFTKPKQPKTMTLPSVDPAPAILNTADSSTPNTLKRKRREPRKSQQPEEGETNNREVPDSQDDSAVASSTASNVEPQPPRRKGGRRRASETAIAPPVEDDSHTVAADGITQLGDEVQDSQEGGTSTAPMSSPVWAFPICFKGPPPEPSPEDTETKGIPSKASPSKGTSAKPSPSKPLTPRHTAIQIANPPSSRRSILSLIDPDSDDDDGDELLGSDGPITLPKLFATASTRKTWKASARTTEVYHTPVKKRRRDPVSPGSVVKTPGGTTRTCGVGGYRCGRDFCFTCL